MVVNSGKLTRPHITPPYSIFTIKNPSFLKPIHPCRDNNQVKQGPLLKMEALELLIPLFESLLTPKYVNFKHGNLDYTPFETLPSEIVICIADLLSRSAAASFALSCRRIRLILGNQHLDPMRPNLQVPLEVACPCCFLHHRCLGERHGNMLRGREQKLWSKLTNKEISICYYISEQFDDITFRSIMNLHRRGIHCSKMLSLFSRVYTAYLCGLTFQSTSAFRIANGSLIFRQQNWILYPDRKMIYPQPVISSRLVVCSHITMFNKFLAGKIVCRLNHWQEVECNRERHWEDGVMRYEEHNGEHDASCSSCSGLFQCKFCPTEFQIDTKDLGRAGVAIVMRRWLDLGEGRTSLDPKWKSRLLLKGRYPTRTPVAFPAGSIKHSF